MNLRTGAVFGFATLYFIPVIWAGLTLPVEWSVLVGALASMAWLISAATTPLSRQMGEIDWLTLPVVYPCLSILLGYLNKTRLRLEEALEREKRVSRVDELTGLLNRRGFFEVIESMAPLAHKNSNRTLAFMDLDRFKSLNDRMGHKVGDSLLAAIGETIRRTQPDIIATRIGGDEFVMLLPPESQAAVKRKLASLKKAIHSACKAFSNDVSASIGAAHFRKAMPQADKALRIVDSLMYSAKRAGRNRLHFESMTPKDWERILEKAGPRRQKALRA
jgi:diguanylate cyclase (GGDEF)-like protein